MFLKAALERNPKLVQTALAFHREGLLPPNCYVIDRDTVAENASLLAEAARHSGLSLYFTTKQIGFNPEIARCAVQSGLLKAVAVDLREASVLSRNGIPIGHVGHLSQVPMHMIGPILGLEPEVVTVMSVAKAEQISRVAARDGRHVRLLLRVVADQDFIYPGQAGGIRFEDLSAAAAAIQRLPNVQIHGVTSFPCLQFDAASHAVKPAPNFGTILKAAEFLKKELGVAVEQINAPGNTCVSTMELLAGMGATHGEPGHALTGTTYLHMQTGEAERPAMVYVSEISHIYCDRAYAFGGGTYRRAQVHNALVGSDLDRMEELKLLPLNPKAIDYYVSMALPPRHSVQVGDTVIIASRAQVFVSRALVAVVKGIQTAEPALVGVYDASGKAVEAFI